MLCIQKLVFSLESDPPEGVSLHGVSLAVVSHLDKICRSMIECCHSGDMRSAHLLSLILSKISAKLCMKEMSVPKVLYCVKAAVLYFFTCLFKEKGWFKSISNFILLLTILLIFFSTCTDEMFKLKACLRMNKFVNTVSYRSSIARTAAMKYILDGVLKEPFSLLFVMPDNRRNDYIIQPLEKTSLMGSFLQQVYNSSN